jgi:preprotein translocase subunit YajC
MNNSNFIPMEGGNTEATWGGSETGIGVGIEPIAGTLEPTNGASQNDAPAGGLFSPMTLLLWGAVIVGMWFMLIRPQRKREKQVREMQAALKVGDPIITTSGFFGKIVGTGTDAFLIEFGENRGLKIWIRKSDIAGIKSPTTTTPRGDDSPTDSK